MTRSLRRPALQLRSSFLAALAAALVACGGAEGDPASGAPGLGSQPSPVLTSVDPGHLPASGGAVIVHGERFSPGARVFLGEEEVAAQRLDQRQLVVSAPAHAPGLVDVTVENEDGQRSTLSAALQFDEAPPPAPSDPPPGSEPPVVLAVNRHGAPQAGGLPMLFVGTGLANVSEVSFGGALATGLSYDAAQGYLLVTVPASPLGPAADGFVEIVLTTHDGQSTTAPAFHYGNPPAPASFTPSAGDRGSTVVISGTDFTADTTGARAGLQVYLGGTIALVMSKTATAITVAVPKLNVGFYQIVVVNFDGQYAVAPGWFTVTSDS